MKNSNKKLKAKQVYYSWRVYQHFLLENGLDDDSEDILVKDLINFIDNQIPQDDKNRLFTLILEMY